VEKPEGLVTVVVEVLACVGASVVVVQAAKSNTKKKAKKWLKSSVLNVP